MITKLHYNNNKRTKLSLNNTGSKRCLEAFTLYLPENKNFRENCACVCSPSSSQIIRVIACSNWPKIKSTTGQ